MNTATLKTLRAELATVEATLAAKQARVNELADMLEIEETAPVRMTYNVLRADIRPVAVRRNELHDEVARRTRENRNARLAA